MTTRTGTTTDGAIRGRVKTFLVRRRPRPKRRCSFVSTRRAARARHVARRSCRVAARGDSEVGSEAGCARSSVRADIGAAYRGWEAWKHLLHMTTSLRAALARHFCKHGPKPVVARAARWCVVLDGMRRLLCCVALAVSATTFGCGDSSSGTSGAGGSGSSTIATTGAGGSKTSTSSAGECGPADPSTGHCQCLQCAACKSASGVCADGCTEGAAATCTVTIQSRRVRGSSIALSS